MPTGAITAFRHSLWHASRLSAEGWSRGGFVVHSMGLMLKTTAGFQTRSGGPNRIYCYLRILETGGSPIDPSSSAGWSKNNSMKIKGDDYKSILC